MDVDSSRPSRCRDRRRELATLSTDMERDIGKVYRKYERLERAIREERERKIRERERKMQHVAAELKAQALNEIS